MAPRIYPSLPGSIPLYCACEMYLAPRIHPSLPEYRPTPLFNNPMRPSRNLSLPPRIYPSFQKLYATLPESTPPPRIYPSFQQLYATLPESTPPLQNIPVTGLFNKHSTLSLCRVNADPASTTLAQH